MNSGVQPKSAGIIAPPPLLYLGALAGGFVLDWLSPLSLLHAPGILRMLGLLLLVMSGAFARWAFVVMKRAGTSADPGKRSMALVTNGPFRLSRNPIYLAMTGLYLGIACLGNSWWPVLLLAPLLAVMHWGVIVREERYLETVFGAAYAAYKSVTRRWI